MTVVFDSIHGQIKFTGNAKEILDHKYFNRCENIKQLGEAHRVFPMALHTRKIHQIGTYLITKKYLEHLEKFVYISEREKELISIGGLCHDLGHVYGSHLFDNNVIRKLIKENKIRRDHEWRDHEERSKILFEKIANDVTDLNDDEIEFVKQIIHPSKKNQNNWKFQIVSNHCGLFDSDRLDYLKRDQLSIGNCHDIDIDLIINATAIIDSEIKFNFEKKSLLDDIIYARYMTLSKLINIHVVKFDKIFEEFVTEDENIQKYIVDAFNGYNIDTMANITREKMMFLASNESIQKYDNRKYFTCLKMIRSSSFFLHKVALMFYRIYSLFTGTIVFSKKINVCSDMSKIFYNKGNLYTDLGNSITSLAKNEYIIYELKKNI